MKKHYTLAMGASLLAVALGSIGCNKSADDTADTSANTPAPAVTAKRPSPAGAAGGPTATQAAVNRPTPGKKNDPFAAKKGMPGAATSANPATPGAAPGMAVASKPARSNPDPFLVTWKDKQLPPPVFDTVQPIRVASANIVAPPPINTVVNEVPTRRVSGIVSGDGVFAILEGDGEPEIVKPGSMTADNYRVVSITADSVKLQRKDGNLLRTQIVPLSDVSTGGTAVARTAGFGGGGRTGGPAAAGFAPAGGGRGGAKGGGGED